MDDQAPPPRRLNPFAFPSETDARFNLLVATAVVVVFNLGITALIKLFFGAFASLSVSGLGLLQGQQADPQQLVRALFSLPLCSGGLIALLMATSYLRYRHHPREIRRKQHLQPPDLQKDSRLLQAVNELTQKAGVSPPPQIELGPVGASDGQAFGLSDQPLLRLGGNVNRQRIKQPGRFRAMVLHELAHVANRDIGRSYFAEAVWKVFLALILPLAAVIVLGYGIAYVELDIPTSALGWLITLIAAGVVMFVNAIILAVEVAVLLWIAGTIRRGALRVREVYADWRAALWGARQGLEEILSENARRPAPGWWQRLRRFHPTPQERLHSLRDPARLFRLGLDLPVSIGFLLGYVIAGGTPILGAALALWGLGFPPEGGADPRLRELAVVLVPLVLLGYLLVTLAAAWLVSATLGLQIQREAVADLATGQAKWSHYWHLWKPALLMPLMFELGVWMMPYDTITVAPLFTRETTLAFLLLPLWMLLLAGTNWAWMAYLRLFSLKLLGAHAGVLPPWGKMRLLNAAGAVLLPLMCLPAALTRLLLVQYHLSQNLVIAAFLLTFFLVAALWGVSWVAAIGLDRSSRRCPGCGENSARPQAVGLTCEHCGSELAPWIYAG